MFHKKCLEEKENLQRENDKMKSILDKPVTSKDLVETILRNDIVWIDKDKMNSTDRLSWGNEAKALLENRVFQSLVGKIDAEGNKTNGEIVKNLIEGIARNSKDYDEVRFLRSTINGIELIREYAEDLLIKKVEETHDDPYAAV